MTDSTRLIIWDAQGILWTGALLTTAIVIPLIAIQMAFREAVHSGVFRGLKDRIALCFAARPHAPRSVLSSPRAFETGCRI
jgi:hypothetical protein